MKTMQPVIDDLFALHFTIPDILLCTDERRIKLGVGFFVSLVIFSPRHPRDFLKVLARLSGSGLAPSGSRNGNVCLTSEHEEISESGKSSENVMPERKVLKIANDMT